MLNFYQVGGGAALDTFALAAVAGLASDPISFELRNSPGVPLADVATEIEISVYERRSGETEWVQTRDLTAGRYVEMRIIGGLGGVPPDPQVTDWTPVGQGRPLLVAPIPGDSGRSIDIRTNVPASGAQGSGEGPDAVEIALRVTSAQYFVAGATGQYAAGARGLPTGIGDGSAAYIVAGGSLAASAVPDANVQAAAVLAVAGGVRQSLPAAVIALSAAAADAALAAGESYLATISIGPAGRVVTKSVKGPSPRPSEDRPAVPDGNVLLGWAERLFSAVIGPANVTSSPALGGFAATVVGLTATLAPGTALCDDRYIRRDGAQDVTLPASLPWSLWLLPVGTVAISDVRPDPRALLLYTGTSGVSTSTLTDRRAWIRTRAGAIRLSFPAALATGQYAYGHYTGDGTGVPTVPFAVWVSLRDNGAGNTSGRTVIDVEHYDGSAWVSIHPAGTAPAIGYAATGTPSIAGTSAALVLSPGDTIRAKVTEIPVGGAPPSGAEISILYEVP